MSPLASAHGAHPQRRTAVQQRGTEDILLSSAWHSSLHSLSKNSRGSLFSPSFVCSCWPIPFTTAAIRETFTEPAGGTAGQRVRRSCCPSRYQPPCHLGSGSRHRPSRG